MVLKTLTSHLKSKENKRLVENFVSLSFLQISNYLLPLITLPYLTRVIGVEKFGLIALTVAVAQYFVLLTDFGFNLTATKEISINRCNNLKISEIFISVYIIKLALFILSSIFLFLLVIVVPAIKTEQNLYVLAFASVLGWLLFPQWLYQGLEKMKFITIFIVSTRIICTSMIFLIVKSPDDYLWVQALSSLGYLVSGLLGFFYSFKIFRFSFTFPQINVLREQVKSGMHVFLSNLSINLYTTSNSVVLGIFTNNTVVGYYSAAERIFKAFQFLGMPLYQAIFPRMSKLYSENRDRAISIFSKIFKITIVVTFLISLIISVSSHIIIPIILGKQFEQSTIIFSLLSWIVVVSWGNYTLGVHGLVNFGYEKIFSKIIVIFGVIHLVLITIGINLFGVLSVPIVWFFTESCICFFEYRFLRKNNLLIL